MKWGHQKNKCKQKPYAHQICMILWSTLVLFVENGFDKKYPLMLFCIIVHHIWHLKLQFSFAPNYDKFYYALCEQKNTNFWNISLSKEVATKKMGHIVNNTKMLHNTIHILALV